MVVCDRWNRRGEFKRETLLAKYGPDAQMTGLEAQIAADAGCADAARGLKDNEFGKLFPCAAHHGIDTST